MGLNSSLFTGVSGLNNIGNALQVIGDNVANVNTVGFKASRFVFQDLLSQNIATQAGTAQVGRGMTIGDVSSDFSQGSMESTGIMTDLAISGSGFFIMRDPEKATNAYTRAGNFRFNKDGYLTNPTGMIVQGWELEQETGDELGAVKDVVLESFSSAPSASDKIRVITNLDSRTDSSTPSVANAWDAWDAEKQEYSKTPIIEPNFQYQTVVKVYDSLGSTHDVSIFYDKIDKTKWEYVVACDPSEDKRNVAMESDSSGLLARGTISFSNTGAISGVTMDTFTGRIGNIRPPASMERDDIRFIIGNYDKFESKGGTGGGDGYNFQLTYDEAGVGAQGPYVWTITDPGTGAAPPASYPNAIVIDNLSNDRKVVIDLDGADADGNFEADLTIMLDKPAVPGGTDAITFDINDPRNLHVQNIVNLSYSPKAPTNPGEIIAKDNAKMEVLNFNALARSTGDTPFTLTWDPTAGAWTMTIPPEYDANTPGVTPFSAKIVNGDKDKVLISMDGDDEGDVLFSFEKSLTSASSITFGVEGSTSWEPKELTSTEPYYKFAVDFLGGEETNTETKIAFDIGSKGDEFGNFTSDTLTSTQYARLSATTFQSGNGYGSGDLKGVDVDSEGTITGIFSNGQLIPLYRVALAQFLNESQLNKEGGNMYTATGESGVAITGKPGATGLGSISSNTLEQGNVDIGTEFVRMITTQRGYQANSKVITTVDTMFGEVINMKR
ncbi:MAG: flagellar hook-basal body complex protein [Desulfobacterales bacterium]|nr:flagellar hook-basal body complex protein [Desulfobacterales bacterium]